MNEQETNSNNLEKTLEKLDLNIDTVYKFFLICPEEIIIKEPGKILFPKFYIDKIDYAVDIWGVFLLLSLPLITFYPFAITLLILFFCIGLYLASLKEYIVLDYIKKEFYYEKRSLFSISKKSLFSFDDIIEIGNSYEKKEKKNSSAIIEKPEIFEEVKICLFLKDNNTFILHKFIRDINTPEIKANEDFAKLLALALKKKYTNNPDRLLLEFKDNHLKTCLEPVGLCEKSDENQEIKENEIADIYSKKYKHWNFAGRIFIMIGNIILLYLIIKFV